MCSFSMKKKKTHLMNEIMFILNTGNTKVRNDTKHTIIEPDYAQNTDHNLKPARISLFHIISATMSNLRLTCWLFFLINYYVFIYIIVHFRTSLCSFVLPFWVPLTLWKFRISKINILAPLLYSLVANRLLNYTGDQANAE